MQLCSMCAPSPEKHADPRFHYYQCRITVVVYVAAVDWLWQFARDIVYCAVCQPCPPLPLCVNSNTALRLPRCKPHIHIVIAFRDRVLRFTWLHDENFSNNRRNFGRRNTCGGLVYRVCRVMWPVKSIISFSKTMAHRNVAA